MVLPPMRIAALSTIALSAMIAIAAPVAARRAPPLMDEVTLDLDRPVIEARIGDRTLRLGVELSGDDVIELGPQAAARLPLRWVRGADAQIGPIVLTGTQAVAKAEIAGQTLPLIVSTHGRDPIPALDGSIRVDMLPYRTVRFVRPAIAPHPAAEPAAPPPAVEIAFPDGENAGLHIPAPIPGGTILLRFSPWEPESLATAAAGAKLAAVADGHLVGTPRPVLGAYWIARASRMLVLGRPVVLAGYFRFTRVAMRLGDFRGTLTQPTIAATGDADGDAILVEGRRKPDQFAWPAILIGRDRLGRCTEIAFRRMPDRLSFACPTGPAGDPGVPGP